MIRCPEDTPCTHCKALIPAGVSCVKVALHPKFAPHLGAIVCWYHLACTPAHFAHHLNEPPTGP